MTIGADTPVGILGDGQLARMLAESAKRLGLVPRAIAEIGDERALESLISESEIIVFENEFIDTDALARVAGKARVAKFRPGLETLARMRDKLGQKKILRDLGIRSAEFRTFDGGDLETWMADTMRALGGGVVLKWGRLGYDGKGVFFLDDFKMQVASAREFCAKATDRGISLFAEARVAFRRELALVACRSYSGEFLSYPLVVSEQKKGICWNVSGPATSLGVSPAREEEAQSHAKRVAEAAGLVGCFAIEFFETQKGELWVNEMAPRVHNSGHYSQDACATSQFENHWRAALGLPLGAPNPRAAFVMGNLLGPAGIERPAAGAALPQPTKNLHLHWYGKTELRPGRKLGHLNAAANDIATLPALVAEMDRCRASWETTLEEKK